MKRLLTILTLAVSLVTVSSFKNTASAQVGVGVNITYQDFYDELSPYGEWMDYPEHGYVWVPRMGNDFQPYRTGGHWAWSEDYEWMWVSDYNWGWAPFHYGRWFMDPIYGWMWVPGYEWSPGWVAWRDGGDYYGWAPLRPGISISIGFGGYNPPVDYWSFAPRRYISSHNIYNYCVPRQQNVTIINHTTIINNYNHRSNVFVSNGPRRYDAERYTGRINPVRVREISTPGRSRVRGNEISVYRPGIRRDNDRNFAPRSFERYDRNGGNNNSVRRNDNRNLGNAGIDRNGRNDNNNEIRNRRDMPERNREVNPSQPANNRPSGNDRIRNRSQEQPNSDRGTIDRNNGNGNIEQPGRRRGERPNGFERRSTDMSSPSENRSIEQPRERRMSAPSQQPNRSFERQERGAAPSQQPSQQPNRSFERQERRAAPSQQPSQQPNRSFERQERRAAPSQQPAQQPNRSFERQERRAAPSQQTSQQPNRTFERQNERRVENTSRGQQSTSESRGNGRGNRRF